MNQRGFATLEVILMVVIIGILATVAVPRFTDVTTKANTAKIQSDLTTIDTAIQMYEMDNGKYPESTDVKVLTEAGYLMETPKPPTGKAYINGTPADIGAENYLIDTTNGRGTLNSNTVGKYTLTATTTTTPTTGE